jgi:predicted FMN-binding regulatory protein PaiB
MNEEGKAVKLLSDIKEELREIKELLRRKNDFNDRERERPWNYAREPPNYYKDVSL